MNETQLYIDIIKEQSQIIGVGLAKVTALNSGVITFKSSSITDITVSGTDLSSNLQSLISSYEVLFGKASVEVCRSVVKKHIGNLPEFLK